MNEVEAEKMKWMEEISNKNNEEISLPNRYGIGVYCWYDTSYKLFDCK